MMTNSGVLADLLLFGVATHKLARLITKDWVTGVVYPRATRFIAGVLAIVAVSDTLQHVYNRTKKLSA